MRRCWLAALVWALAWGPEGGGIARAQDDGVTEDSILFGQSAAFSGPTGLLGTDYRAGVLAAFAEANARGGVHGRRLDLLSLDDGYEPEEAINNTHRLLDEERVFALIAYVGSPTARATVPIAAAQDVPFVAPLTGAAFLRDEQWTNVVNLRASYAQEMAEIVERLVLDLGIVRIGVLYQDDSFGLAGLTGVEDALAKRGLATVARAVYPRNTSAIKTGVLELREADPQAVLLIGAYSPVATAVAWSRHLGMDAVFATTSFVGGNALIDRLRSFGQFGLYVTQVIPSPTYDSLAARQYRRAMAAHSSGVKPGFVSFEGYLAGRLAIEGLERSGQAVDRVVFLENLLDGEPFNLGGVRLSFSARRNQGSDRVYVNLIAENGQIRTVQTLAEDP